MPSDRERLNLLLKFLNENPVTSCNGMKKWGRYKIDLAIKFHSRRASKKKGGRNAKR